MNMDQKDLNNTTPNKSSIAEETTPTKESLEQNNPTVVVWDDYFMFLALLSAKRSKDPVTQVGACIVDNENRIVAIGYNGLPRNCHDDEFPWGKADDDQFNDKKMYVVHAEANAILNKNSVSVSGMRLYTTLFPCNECTKLIIQSGIEIVYYLTDKYEDKPKYRASKRMFDATGVKYKRVEPQRMHLQLDFEEIIAVDFEKLQLNSPEPSRTTSVQNPQQKRLNYIHWDDYFMAIALLSAKLSKDRETQVGACIVDSWHRIVAIGCNKLPRNCNENEFFGGKSSDLISNRKIFVVHAEANAILNKNVKSGSGTRLYTTRFPCNECTKLIVQTGIAEIFYLTDQVSEKPKYKAAKCMLDAAGIVYKRFKPSGSSIQLDFDEVLRDDPTTPFKKKKDIQS